MYTRPSYAREDGREERRVELRLADYRVGFGLRAVLVGVRDLLDLGVEGGLLVLGLLDENGLLALGWIVWMFFPGTKGPNKYGDDPKNPQNLGTVFA